MAGWCLAMQQSVETYRSLTRDERDAFVRVYNRANRRR